MTKRYEPRIGIEKYLVQMAMDLTEECKQLVRLIGEYDTTKLKEIGDSFGVGQELQRKLHEYCAVASLANRLRAVPDTKFCRIGYNERNEWELDVTDNPDTIEGRIGYQ